MKYEMVVDVRARIAFDDGDSKVFEEWSPEFRAERIAAVKADAENDIRREFGMSADDPLEVSIEVREVSEVAEVTEVVE